MKFAHAIDGWFPLTRILSLRNEVYPARSPEKSTAMFHRFSCAGRRSGIPTLVCMAILAIAEPLWPASCVGPTQLEARVRSHPDADAYRALGSWFGQNRKSQCAVRAFQAGIKLEPNSSHLLYLLGLSYYTAGMKQESVFPLQDAVRLDPSDEGAHLLLASALAGLGHSDEAFVEWQAALRIDPKSKMALDGISKILLAAGDNESVIAQLSSMPLDENLALDLAVACGRAGQLDNAARTLNQGLKSYPDSTLLTASLVSVYVQQVRLAEAERTAQRLVRRKPRDIEAQRVYLQVLVLNAENQTAVPLARKLLRQAPHDADFLYLNGELERTSGDFAAARKHLEEAAKLDPDRYSTRFNLGCTLEQLEDPRDAKEQFEKAIELDPTEPESHFELAKVLRKLGETDRAQQQLLLYQSQLKDRSDRSLAAQKSTQAAAALRADDKQRAAALYREAITALPNNPALLYQLALVLGELNDTKGARAALDQAVTIDPTFALAQYQLGNLEFRDGNTVGAEQRFRLAVKASPGYAQAWLALAVALGTESRFSDALEAVDAALKIAPENSKALEFRQHLVASQAEHEPR